MKVRVSMPGASVSMEIEDKQAAETFKDLAVRLIEVKQQDQSYTPAIKCSNNYPFTLRELEEEFRKVAAVVNNTAIPPKPLKETDAGQDLGDQMKPAKQNQTINSGYKGFLHIRCEACGKIKTFCAKEHLNSHRCDCGHQTELKHMAAIWSHCECGKNSKYMTNIEEPLFDVDCICGIPVPVKWNSKRGLYETIR